MKKVFLLVFTLLAILVVGCNNKNEEHSNDQADNTNTLETRVVSGSATLTWHFNETFMAIVDVTLEGDVIKKVEVRDSSYVHTGESAFRLWVENKDYYLQSFEGLTIDQIKALEANDPADVSNHNDGGSMSGDVDAIAGATASSTVVAKAVKAAIINAIS